MALANNPLALQKKPVYQQYSNPSTNQSAAATTMTKTNKWQSQLEDLYNQIQNRGAFKYDQANDPMYKQYAEMYQKNAQMGMQDTMAQASALTGGYGNSFAQAAGQAAYQGVMNQLNDKALELQQMALQQYNAEGDRLANMFGMVSNMYDTEYAHQRDAIADEQWQKQFDADNDRYNQDMAYKYAALRQDNNQFYDNLDYQKERAKASDEQWQKEYDAKNDQWQKNYDYQKERDDISDTRYAEKIIQDQKNYESDLAFKYASAGLNRDGSLTASAKADRDAQLRLDYLKAGYDYDAKSGTYKSLAGAQDEADNGNYLVDYNTLVTNLPSEKSFEDVKDRKEYSKYDTSSYNKFLDSYIEDLYNRHLISPSTAKQFMANYISKP